MKTICCCVKSGLFLGLSLLVLTFKTNAFAQTTGSTIPVVTIKATQPIASGPGQPGIFTVFRQGNTNEILNAYYNIGGTASNGVDYQAISQWVNIPAGIISNTITITPINNASATTVKTVSLQLAPSPALNPVNFEIGVPSNAVVYITGPNATNIPPDVKIISPDDGSVYYAPTNILLMAKATDPDGTITSVEFFADTNDLGPGSPIALDPPGVNGVTGLVYVYNWQNVPVGDYPLTAVATDNGGASTVSPVVNITVLQGPPTNLPPIVRMVSPANGSVFYAPINLPLFAFAKDPDGSVTSVQFFAGGNSVGFGQPLPTPVAAGASNPSPIPPIYPTNLFVLIWTNAPVGTDSLTAVATDNGGLSSTSAPITITILPPQPPPTNRPPIMSIVATDPIAIEGTNSWVWPGETNSPATWAAWPTAVCRFFTNCGPKTATFTVYRFGDTNGDLTVNYNIGGTASNGVDYVALPGSVTVAAGQRRALITIIPIDDGPPDINKTVILALTPSTNTPPDYIVGFPPRAAAIIIDPPGPCPVAGMLPDKCFRLSAPGPDGVWFCIEYSTNLSDWTPICTNQVINGSIDFIDPDAPNNPNRYYRAVPVTSVPGD